MGIYIYICRFSRSCSIILLVWMASLPLLPIGSMVWWTPIHVESLSMWPTLTIHNIIHTRHVHVVANWWIVSPHVAHIHGLARIFIYIHIFTICGRNRTTPLGYTLVLLAAHYFFLGPLFLSRGFPCGSSAWAGRWIATWEASLTQSHHTPPSGNIGIALCPPPL